MKTLKQIGKIALDVLIVLICLISACVIIANASAKEGEQPNIFGFIISSVQTDSMEDTIMVGDIIVSKVVKEDTVIEEDAIISFKSTISGQNVIKTHRVVEIEEIGGVKCYYTKGDNPAVGQDSGFRTMNDIVAVYKFRVPVVGSIIDFLKKPIGFIIFLVLPLLAIIGWQVYKLVVIYMESKREKILEEAKDGVSEEAKEAIIKEFLMKQQAESEAKKQAEAEAARQTEVPQTEPTERALENDAGEEK